MRWMSGGVPGAGPRVCTSLIKLTIAVSYMQLEHEEGLGRYVEFARSQPHFAVRSAHLLSQLPVHVGKYLVWFFPCFASFVPSINTTMSQVPAISALYWLVPGYPGAVIPQCPRLVTVYCPGGLFVGD